MSGVWHDEDERAWLLEMRSTGYALGVADGGAAVRHLYWGPALPREAVAALAAGSRAEPGPWERQHSWGRELPDEYVPWGGLRYDEPSLRAEFADGTRAVAWRFAGQRASRRGDVTTLELDLADGAYGLEVTLYYRVFDGFDVLERWAAVRHRGDRPAVIRQALSANWWLPPAATGGCATCTAAGRRRPSSPRPRWARGNWSWKAGAAPPATTSTRGSPSTRTVPRPRAAARCGAGRWPGAARGSSCSRPPRPAGCTPAAA